MSGSHALVTKETARKQLGLSVFCAPSAGFRAPSSQVSGNKFNKIEAKPREEKSA